MHYSAWDTLAPVEEALSFLDAAVSAGKINYAGLSNFAGWQHQLVVSTARTMGCQVTITLRQQDSPRSPRPSSAHVPSSSSAIT